MSSSCSLKDISSVHLSTRSHAWRELLTNRQWHILIEGVPVLVAIEVAESDSEFDCYWKNGFDAFVADVVAADSHWDYYFAGRIPVVLVAVDMEREASLAETVAVDSDIVLVVVAYWDSCYCSDLYEDWKDRVHIPLDVAAASQ